MIVIIDYGMGNLRSIKNKFDRMGVDSIISMQVDEIEKADKLVLPGVGHFKAGMENLTQLGILPILNKRVLEDKIPILGICLGMQLLSDWSEEGNAAGLGWIDAKTVKLNFNGNGSKLKIPHMGWNSIEKRRENCLLKNITFDADFYFVHSYHVICNDKNDILSTTLYGYNITSAINKENIYGTQFHPEKSHDQGMQILKNFVELK